jgi:hypothetical protein
LRSPGTVFRQLTIDGLHRDLSAEIVEVNLLFGPTKTEKNSCLTRITASRLTIWRAGNLFVRR